MKQFNFLSAKQSIGLRSLWIIFILVMTMEIRGWAAIKTNTGNNWTNDAHWSPSGVPTNTDDVIISNTMLTSYNDTRSCLSLTINTGSTLSINKNSTVIVGDGGVTINGTGLISLNTNSFLRYSPNSTLTYSGVTRKSVGNEWPTANGPASVTINNSAGVKLGTTKELVNDITINLLQGLFETDNHLKITATSTINRSGGSIKGTLYGTGIYNVNYTGNSKTTGSELSEFGLNNITVNLNDGQTLTLSQNRSPNGNIVVSSGIFDLSSFTINRSSEGGALSITNGATLKIGGTNTFPANYSTHTIGTTSCVNYSGTSQQVSNETYGNFITSGTGMKFISAGSAVTVSGNLTTNGLLAINSDGTSSGSLIVNGSSIGHVTYNRWMNSAAAPATYSRWYITSAPVDVESGFNDAKYDGITSNVSKIHLTSRDGTSPVMEYDFAIYNESVNDWTYYVPGTLPFPDHLIAGKGYLISLKSESDGIIKFTGALNNKNISSIVTSSPHNGWNALGNPYTSAIGIKSSASSAEDFLTKNLSQLSENYAAIYVWNESGTYDGNQQYYKIIGNGGYTPPENFGGTISENYIQAGQGFLINAKSNSTITFTKAMQAHQPTVTLKSSTVSWPGMTLLAESHGQRRSTVVAYNDQMTTGLDVSYDAGLLASDVFQVYTHLVEGTNPIDFAIQCLPDNQYGELTVPVGVDLPEGGELIFKVTGLILPQGLYPVIEDKQLGISTPLKTETDSYTVVLDKNTRGTGRFYLSVEGIGVGTTEMAAERKFTASLINNRLVVWGAVEPGTKALLYDLSGRKLGEFVLLNQHYNEISIMGWNLGICLLKIDAKNYRQVIKVVGK